MFFLLDDRHDKVCLYIYIYYILKCFGLVCSQLFCGVRVMAFSVSVCVCVCVCVAGAGAVSRDGHSVLVRRALLRLTNQQDLEPHREF